METLTGSVERITYYNPENGYSVVRLKPDQHPGHGTARGELATVIGNLDKFELWNPELYEQYMKDADEHLVETAENLGIERF